MLLAFDVDRLALDDGELDGDEAEDADGEVAEIGAIDVLEWLALEDDGVAGTDVALEDKEVDKPETLTLLGEVKVDADLWLLTVGVCVAELEWCVLLVSCIEVLVLWVL